MCVCVCVCVCVSVCVCVCVCECICTRLSDNFIILLYLIQAIVRNAPIRLIRHFEDCFSICGSLFEKNLIFEINTIMLKIHDFEIFQTYRKYSL